MVKVCNDAVVYSRILWQIDVYGHRPVGNLDSDYRSTTGH